MASARKKPRVNFSAIADSEKSRFGRRVTRMNSPESVICARRLGGPGSMKLAVRSNFKDREASSQSCTVMRQGGRERVAVGESKDMPDENLPTQKASAKGFKFPLPKKHCHGPPSLGSEGCTCGRHAARAILKVKICVEGCGDASEGYRGCKQ